MSIVHPWVIRMVKFCWECGELPTSGDRKGDKDTDLPSAAACDRAVQGAEAPKKKDKKVCLRLWWGLNWKCPSQAHILSDYVPASGTV